MSKPKVDSKPHNTFEKLREQYVPALKATLVEYRHKKTGASHLHIAADNKENVFLVGLRTVPMDSKGEAHILEHTALCGSERYPVRDPFFMMIRRSINTFMNAFTSSDWTAYPFASCSEKDFYNLLDVYLDAVFFSRISELDFRQEGHRLEFEKADDPSTPLQFKGVVFNEMKGAMSSVDRQVYHELERHLFPFSTYHYNSGGDPEHIPDLSYEELKRFYATYYHPSNAFFVTYGNLPAHRHQKVFEEKALHRFEKSDAFIEVSPEKRLHAPVEVLSHYADMSPEPLEERSHVVMGWLFGESANMEDKLKAELMHRLLLGDSASPLMQALENTDLGKAPSSLLGMSDDARELAFFCGLEGTDPDKAAAIEELILSTLKNVADKGIPKKRLEAVFQQMEISELEISGGYPYGLGLTMRVMGSLVHRGDPFQNLDVVPRLTELKKEVMKPGFVEKLIHETLLDNPHRVRLTMVPSKELPLRREATEKARLQAIKDGLTPAETKEIVKQAKALADRQKQVDDVEILPKVELADVPRSVSLAKGSYRQLAGSKAGIFDQPTNGLVYQHVVVPLPEMPEEMLEDLRVYIRLLTEVGVGQKSYLEVQEWQSAVGSGIYAGGNLTARVDDEQKFIGYINLKGKTLAGSEARLADLLAKTLDGARFDELERIRSIVAQVVAGLEAGITGNGHSVAMGVASSGMSGPSRLSEKLFGLEGVKSLKALEKTLKDEKALKALAKRMERIHKIVSGADRHFLLIGEGDASAMEKSIAKAFKAPKAGTKLLRTQAVNETVKQMWLINTQANFCAKAFKTVPSSHPDAAALMVLGGYLRNGYLHTAIRENGGAYGGGAGYDGESGSFRFYSYRDPRIEGTLADFDRSIEWLLAGGHDPRLLEEAVLGVAGKMDAPSSPAGEAHRAFYGEMRGKTKKYLETLKTRVMAVTMDDLERVAKAYLADPNKASVVVLTSPETHKKVGDLGLMVHQL